jgi:hypothetical protein
MKKLRQNGLSHQNKITSFQKSTFSSIVLFMRKMGLLFFFIGIVLTLNSCEKEEQSSTPNINEPEPTGTILIKINTKGKDDDPDGYTLNVEGTASREVGPNEEVTISNKKVGKYNIELLGIASHCTGTGNMVREVNVSANGTATIEFEVECKAVLRDRIAYNKGTANFTDFKFYSSKLDGTDEKVILDKVIPPNRMNISPDGTKIAFMDRFQFEGTTILQTFIMDADGENIEMIPFDESISANPFLLSQVFPIWHPDGKKLTLRNGPRTVTYDMETGNASILELGPNQSFAVNEVFDNGNKFLGVFAIVTPGEPIVRKIATMNLNGTDIKFLKESSNLLFFDPRIINGNTIGYLQRVSTPGFFNEFWKMGLDGSDDMKVNSSLGFPESEVLNSFTVSPDGTEFIFFVSSGPNFYLSRSKLNGTPQQLNFSAPGVRNNPVWSPVTRK